MTDQEAEAILTEEIPEATWLPDDRERKTAESTRGQEEIEAVFTQDPEAPYGRFANGKPRKRPQKAPGERPAPAPRKTGTRPRTSRPGYSERITEAIKFPTAVLALVGNARGSEPLVADAAALTLYGPQFGTALGGLAERKPEVAAVLDKILAAGPYSEVIAVIGVMGLQIAANHKLMQPVKQMGIMTTEEIMDAVAQS